MPEILGGADDEGRFVVVVEGAQAEEVLAVAFERDAGLRGQALQGDFLF